MAVEQIASPGGLPPENVDDNGHQIENGPSEKIQRVCKGNQIDNYYQAKEQQEIRETSQQASGCPPVTVLLKQKSLTDRQQENNDMLIKCLMEEKRFDKSRPVAACIVYKALLQWRSFEAEKTNIFDKIVHAIRSSIESHDNTMDLAYWLSTTSTLLLLLQSTIKASNMSNSSSRRSRNSPTTLFGRMAKGFRASSMSMGISSGYSGMEENPTVRSQIEAKYPALLFKQHLTAYVEKLYGMIRDSSKKEISPFLNLCIQVIGKMRALTVEDSTSMPNNTFLLSQ